MIKKNEKERASLFSLLWGCRRSKRLKKNNDASILLNQGKRLAREKGDLTFLGIFKEEEKK